mmetsp:Transcript_6869/g.14840  ORF Transcript_6869/g.14840 Transcript_6869/m.14840 type:complete len:86 (-) Transcript_6869:27-284(-)
MPGSTHLRRLGPDELLEPFVGSVSGQPPSVGRPGQETVDQEPFITVTVGILGLSIGIGRRHGHRRPLFQMMMQNLFHDEFFTKKI